MFGFPLINLLLGLGGFFSLRRKEASPNIFILKPPFSRLLELAEEPANHNGSSNDNVVGFPYRIRGALQEIVTPLKRNKDILKEDAFKIDVKRKK